MYPLPQDSVSRGETHCLKRCLLVILDSFFFTEEQKLTCSWPDGLLCFLFADVTLLVTSHFSIGLIPHMHAFIMRSCRGTLQCVLTQLEFLKGEKISGAKNNRITVFESQLDDMV